MIRLEVDPKAFSMFVKIDNLDKSMKRGIRQGFYRSGKKLIFDTSKDILRKPRSGRVYMVRLGPKRRIRHKASVAGEAPANRKGKLRRSLDFVVNGWESMDFGYEQDYGKWLEEGTKRMKARPALFLNAVKNKTRMGSFFRQEIDKHITR